MTQIDFYTRVSNKLSIACRLAAKAHSRNMRVALLCPDEATVRKLDQLLWSAAPLSFVPHCAADHPLAARTPVVIASMDDAPGHDDVLVNLRDEWPPSFSRFQRLVELVSDDDADKSAARARYKFYRDRGYEIRTHDLSTSEG